MSEEPFFRVDKFSVPAASRPRFIERLRRTHDALDEAPGCEQNMILEQIEGTGRFNIVTFVRWRNRACYDEARTAAKERQDRSGFNPQVFMDELCVVSDLGNYACLGEGS